MSVRHGPRLATWLLVATASAAVSLGSPMPGVARGPSLPAPAHPRPIGVLPSDLIALANDGARTTEAVPVSIGVRDSAARVAVEHLVIRLGGTLQAAALTTIEASVPAGSLATIGADRAVTRVGSLARPLWLPATARVAQTVGANVWTEAGVDGAGVRVGVIDQFEGIEKLVGTAIPNRLHVRCYPFYLAGSTEIGTDLEGCADRWSGPHGTAVVETISSIAPGAELYLAQPLTHLQVGDAIDWFAAEGVRVVNASFVATAIFEGPGDGTYDEEANTFYAFVDHAVSHGMLWVNAAGNEDHGVYEATFDGGGGNTCLHDFATGADTNRVWLDEDESVVVALRWDDSWEKPGSDLDLVLYSPDGVVDVADSADTNARTGRPVEALVYTAGKAGAYGIGVSRWGGPPVHFELHTSATLEFRTESPSLASPVDTRNAGAIAAGAVRVGAPDFVEWFSSHGPTRDGRQKPDLVTPDCGTTETVDPFCGTSQSTPVAVGVAALLLAGDPGLGDPVRLADALRASTVPVPYAAAREVGAGLLHLAPPPAAVPAPPERLGLTLALPAKPAVYGTRVTARVAGASGAAGRTVAIEAWRDGAWARIAAGTVRVDGTAAIGWKAARGGLLRARLVPGEGVPDGESEPAVLAVIARISVAADPPARNIKANTVVRYTVSVDPPAPTSGPFASWGPDATVEVRFGNRWKQVASLGPTAGKAGTWTFDVRWTRGLWRISFAWWAWGTPEVEKVATDPLEVNAK